ncbi:hypothetical protein FA15DRAFT_710525 [Coprinopsis marcescibilis]|uniref:Uncharacterized protein n=1 Tax=Coprinopsis marcescibilis TaxID=230819 RepID=A0A5C3KCB9_COPMA|nr:hypothetical protein FA15DRAFT_710525 [Coprinopsis marcescibilis]
MHIAAQQAERASHVLDSPQHHCTPAPWSLLPQPSPHHQPHHLVEDPFASGPASQPLLMQVQIGNQPFLLACPLAQMLANLPPPPEHVAAACNPIAYHHAPWQRLPPCQHSPTPAPRIEASPAPVPPRQGCPPHQNDAPPPPRAESPPQQRRGHPPRQHSPAAEPIIPPPPPPPLGRPHAQAVVPAAGHPFNPSWHVFSVGQLDIVCPSCRALHWKAECLSKSTHANPLFGMYCFSGKINLLPFATPPNELKDLLTGMDAESKAFRQNIRQYNDSLAFTSVGCKMINMPGGGYCFKV